MSRAGVFVQQPSGYRAFTPAPLPPQPAVEMDSDLVNLLSQADRVIGRLDMVTEVLPNPDLFIGMYVRQEAVLSSQIEGTQSTLDPADGVVHPLSICAGRRIMAIRGEVRAGRSSVRGAPAPRHEVR